MKRLYIIFTALFACAIAFAQHPHSRGGSPLYWAIVGGISAGLISVIYWIVPFVISFFKRRVNRNSEDTPIENHAKGTKEEGTTIITVAHNSGKEEQTGESKKINVCDDSMSKNNLHVRSKKQIIVTLVVCSFLLLFSILAIELHINNKRDKLFSEMQEHINNSFKNDEESQFVEALLDESIEDLEYAEIAIPAFPNEGDKHEKKHWMNMFMGVEHLYKITDGGWTMSGEIYHPVPYEDGIYRNGIQEYSYIPYMICVPEGADFNLSIAKSIVNKALDNVYREPSDYNSVRDAMSYSNEYYEMIGHFYGDRVPEKGGIPFYNKSTGTKPIFDNGKFSGYYWFGMQTIGQYRVLMAYRNGIAWNVVEKRGLSASVKDRVLFYGLAFALIVSIIILYRFTDKIKFKSKRMARVEKAENQMYCKHCGKLIDANSDYCRYCGKKVKEFS